jgi:hypothetical protein
MFMEKEPSYVIAAIQGFGLLALGTIGVLVLCGLVGALLDMVLHLVKSNLLRI